MRGGKNLTLSREAWGGSAAPRRSRSTTGRLAAALAAVLTLVVVGCARTSPEAERPQTEPPQVEHLTIVAKDFSFEGIPQTIRGGAVSVTFRNRGEVAHELRLVDLGRTSFETFKKVLPKLEEGGSMPSYVRGGMHPFFDTRPGRSKTSTFTLPAGRWTFYCSLNEWTAGPLEERLRTRPTEDQLRPFYERGQYATVTVDDGETDLPVQTDGELVARDYSYEVPPLKVGVNELVFRNAAPKQWHNVVTFEYPKGVDLQEATEAFNVSLQREGPLPEGVPEGAEIGGAGRFSPGLGQTIKLRFQAGRIYVFGCFVGDLDGGPPHAIEHGMFKIFTVG